ncbi:uncharacterized protein LOC123884387 [Trifolium pratense]|uniref:uncharacterized protein LOC123884387 n=1 Tax=Trifolium pratense TaxID=57577 RepID=UPI001E697E16|nr:uncharacterized protein LOC123884387 [Trifolium pratense]
MDLPINYIVIYTGLPAVIKGNPSTIIELVRPLLEKGDLNTIIDPRLKGKFDVNLGWKVLGLAISCTASTSIQRPTMSVVLTELKQCVNLESTSTSERDIFVPPRHIYSALIDPDTKQWNRQLVVQTFYPDEAKQILSIPISQRLPADKIIWHYERDGEFFVRSAHHLLKQHNSRDVAASSGQQMNNLWREIWKAPVPNRVRNFLWRLGKNILPTRANLVRKGVQIENLCPQCHSAPETIDHLFLHCHLTQLTWFASQLGARVPQSMPVHIWLLQGLTCDDTRGAQLFCVLMWKIWNARNNLVFNNKLVDPIAIAHEAMYFMQELSPSPHENNATLMQDAVLAAQPMPSAPHVFYVDGGCFSGNATGWGMVIYNQSGHVVLSACRKELIDVEPVLAEAIGVRWCLQKAIELNMTDIVIVSDAATVVSCINSNKPVAVIDLVIQDCNLLIEQLDSVVVTHVRRHLNVVAH